MSTLVLVRHAQARPFDADSDRLSDLGEQQAIALGEFWRSRGIQFDEVYTGAMQRHTRTAILAGYEQFRQSADFDEYDANSILRSLPDYAPPTDNRHLQKMFDTAMPLWIAGKLASPGIESWQAFKERVTRGLRAIIEQEGPSRKVAVFTSAGPIGIAVQTVLKSPDPIAIELNWRMRNCSVTEFLFTRGRVSLDTFNATPHLREVTYR